ncbi:uncharacterized protein LOC142541034 isoform X1 [Primulina tabacum]|uniref:uncharacterized protein LOC142541034 isoform X1 n=1 Tax=Primulina tabacum TaxID=48773 RepID=UPI003F5A812B
MTAANHSDTSSFHRPLLSSETEPTQAQYVFVLPPYPPPNHHILLRKSCRRGIISCATVLIFLAAALYILWPFDPELSVVRLRLVRLRFHMSPKVSIDATLNLSVRIRNQDFYSVRYDSSVVSIGYRGKKLGDVTSDGGYIAARASSYVNAMLQLERVEIMSDVIMLLEDLAKGEIMFDTETQIHGKLRVFFFDLPLKTKISCEIVADTRNETIYRQSCSPEVNVILYSLSSFNPFKKVERPHSRFQFNCAK